MADRYILQPSEKIADGFVLTDTELGIVLTFVRGQFNETQKVTFLDDMVNPDPMAVARAMRMMAQWLADEHPETLVRNRDGQAGIKRSDAMAEFRQSERERMGLMIKAERERQGMTLRQLAPLCGISNAHLSNIENGRYAVTIDILASIASALGKRITLE